MLPRLVPEILSKCAFCDGVGGGVGIGDSRSLILSPVCIKLLKIVLSLYDNVGYSRDFFKYCGISSSGRKVLWKIVLRLKMNVG